MITLNGATARMVAGAMAAALMAGCAVTPPAEPYKATGRESAPAAALAEKLKEPLGLQDCVDVALANSPQVAGTLQEARAAAAARDVAAGARWPTLGAVGGYSGTLDDQRLVGPRGPGEPGTWSSNIFSADFVVSMPIFTGGRIINEIAAADLLTRAADRRLSRTKNELVFNVSSTFYSILAQRRVIESLIFSQKTLEEHHKRAQDLMAAQKAAKVDLLRTQVRLADIEQKLVSARNTLSVLRRLLANLMGVAGDGDALDITGELAAVPVATDVEQQVETAYARRNDYLAARAEVESQARRVDVARAGHWPVISLVGSYGGRWAGGDRTSLAGADDSEDVGSAGVSVNVPIFDGGSISARISHERAKLAAARERLRGLELGIRLEVETAALNIASGLERVRATEKAIDAATESLRIEREKYDLGRGSITDVLDAQSALLDTQTTYYRALAASNISRAQLRLSVGGEQWQAD